MIKLGDTVLSANSDLLSIRTICDLLSISKPTALRYAKLGRFGEPVRMSPRMVRYRKDAVEDFLAAAMNAA